MKYESRTVLHYISLLQRHTKRYFDLLLHHDHIGSGQQYFLLRIYENDGITMQELANIGGFDKGTATRAVQKLRQQGLVCIETDIQDHRIRHIHITDKASALVNHIYKVRDAWMNTIMQDLPEETKALLLSALDKMAIRSESALDVLSTSHEYLNDYSV